jgi:hypothetical protein
LRQKKKSVTAAMPTAKRVNPTMIKGVCDRRSAKEKDGLRSVESIRDGSMDMVITRAAAVRQMALTKRAGRLVHCVTQRGGY